MQLDWRILTHVKSQPYSLLFVTISGAHLYGFASPDSDYDLRGAHVLPVCETSGLHDKHETIEHSVTSDGLEIDFVTHDVKKFLLLLLKKNGYVLEQLLSPLVVLTTPAHDVLKQIAGRCITKHHSHHYFGFARTQWGLFTSQQPRRVKPLLYVYRILLTGIHLMQTARIEANLVQLNEQFRLPSIPELIEQKVLGPEHVVLSDADVAFHEREFMRLRNLLQTEFERTSLPEKPAGKPLLNEFLQLTRAGSAWRGHDLDQPGSTHGAALCPVCGMAVIRVTDEPQRGRCPRCWWPDWGPSGSTASAALSVDQARSVWQTASRTATR
jgi:hypothetical protein